ncbi:MAG: FGGY-family carbohydrate kinase [Polyangia bacterium]|jgi:xylulokinase
MAQYLGLDSSTQSLSALLIETGGKVLLQKSVSFGERLPQYRSPKGFLPGPDPSVIHADPLMWVDALEMLLGELRAAGADLAQVRGISGAGQQHGSVYLSTSLDGVGDWSPSVPLRDQVRPLLSRATAPIWMDSSTGAECAEIARAAGGDDQVAAISGSRATPRFTGPQIRRFYKTAPAEWQRTAEIQLVSSFIASLLVAKSASIDTGDGAGMNLLDLASGQWSSTLLDATAPGLAHKLKPAVASTAVVGEVAGYFVKKFGFAPGTRVVAFTGDNPSSLVGMGASRPGSAVISLGTSDTVFAAMSSPRPDPKGYGSVFGNPAGGFMSLACFANGSLAREEIARKFGLSWDDFARAIVSESKPGNGGNLLLPFFVPEITPRVPRPSPRWFGSESFIAGKDAAAAARAVVETQALSMRLHSAWIGETMKTVLVTGGASRNPGLLRVLADVFQATITPLAVANSSALGGALRAASVLGGHSWDELFARFAPPERELSVKPDPSTRSIYEKMTAELVSKLSQVM